MTGAKSAEALATEQAWQDQRQADAGKMFRFWLPHTGGEAMVTFLDGGLGPDGAVHIPTFYEHRMNFSKTGGNDWREFHCLAMMEESQACPLCEMGEKPTLMGLLTIMNHTPYTVQKGLNKGNVIKDRRQLFIPARQAIASLMNVGLHAQGLMYKTFIITRTSQREPRVGAQFILKGPNDPEEFQKQYGEDAFPANYEEELPVVSEDDLRKMGLGSTTAAGIVGGDYIPAAADGAASVADKL